MDIQKIYAMIEKFGIGVIGVVMTFYLYNDFKSILVDQIQNIQIVQNELVISNNLQKQRLELIEKEQVDLKLTVKDILTLKK